MVRVGVANCHQKSRRVSKMRSVKGHRPPSSYVAHPHQGPATASIKIEPAYFKTVYSHFWVTLHSPEVSEVIMEVSCDGRSNVQRQERRLLSPMSSAVGGSVLFARNRGSVSDFTVASHADRFDASLYAVLSSVSCPVDEARHEMKQLTPTPTGRVRQSALACVLAYYGHRGGDNSLGVCARSTLYRASRLCLSRSPDVGFVVSSDQAKKR
jgi:hypothetical protein